MAGIRIPFLAEVRDFLRGTREVTGSVDDVIDTLVDLSDAGADVGKDVERGLDKASDALDDLGRDAKDAGRDLDKHLSDGAKDGADAAEKLERKFSEAFDSVSRDAKRSGNDVGDDTERGMRKASQATDDFKNEAKANLSESVSSFRGDLEDIPQIAQDVLGGVIPDLGAVGAGVAAAGAAAIGIAVQQMQNLADRINESKEKMGELVLTFAEAEEGIASVDFIGTVREWAVEIQDARSWFELWQTDAVNNLEAVAAAAGVADTDLRDFWEAMTAPDQDSSLKYLEGLEQRLQDVNDAWLEADTLAGTYGTASRDKADALKAEKDALNDLVDPLREQIDNSKEAYDQSVLLRSIEEDVSEEYIRQRDAINANNTEIEKSNELKNEAVDLAGEAFLAEGGYNLAVAENTAAIAANNAAIADANTTELDRQRLLQENKEAVVAIASDTRTYAQTMADSGATQEDVNATLAAGRTAFLEAANAAGIGATEADGLANSLGLVPDNITPTVKVEGTAQAQTDVQNTKGELEKIAGKTYTADVDVKVKPLGSLIQDAVNAAARAVVPPSVAVSPTLGMRRTA